MLTASDPSLLRVICDLGGEQVPLDFAAGLPSILILVSIVPCKQVKVENGNPTWGGGEGLPSTPPHMQPTSKGTEEGVGGWSGGSPGPWGHLPRLSYWVPTL